MRVAHQETVLPELVVGIGPLIYVAEEIVELVNVQFARVLIYTSEVLPINKFLKVKVNDILCNIRMTEEIAGGVMVREYVQMSMEENTESKDNDEEEYSIASRVSGDMGEEFVSKKVEGEEQIPGGRSAEGSETTKKVMERCEDSNGRMVETESLQHSEKQNDAQNTMMLSRGVSEMAKSVLHVTCNNNVTKFHVFETVANGEVDINNGPCNEAHAMT